MTTSPPAPAQRGHNSAQDDDDDDGVIILGAFLRFLLMSIIHARCVKQKLLATSDARPQLLGFVGPLANTSQR